CGRGSRRCRPRARRLRNAPHHRRVKPAVVFVFAGRVPGGVGIRLASAIPPPGGFHSPQARGGPHTLVPLVCSSRRMERVMPGALKTKLLAGLAVALFAGLSTVPASAAGREVVAYRL